VNIDGKHERDLCDEHADGLREIWLNRRQAYIVSWGLTPQERLTKDAERRANDAERLGLLLSKFGEPRWEDLRERREQEARDRDARARDAGLNWWEVELEELEDGYTTEERAVEEIEELRWAIQDLSDAIDSYSGPIVRVRVRTD